MIITTPRGFSRKKRYPALFCFHGAGGKAEGQSIRWSPQADKRDIIVISVEAVQPLAMFNFKDGFHPTHNDDVGLVEKVIQSLIANKSIEPTAIYTTGHSSGGLFSYRLAKELDLFAAAAPMSCGMVKGAHEPDEKTHPISIIQVIGDLDKSFNGSNKKATMYSAKERIDIWRRFNDCQSEPVTTKHGRKITLHTYSSLSGHQVAYCKVSGEGHHLKRELRDAADELAIDFLLKHNKEQERPQNLVGQSVDAYNLEPY
jgi:poly(3-hydroxybutyrate) depolymerase